MNTVARVVVGAIAGLALGAAIAPAPARAADMPLAMPYAPVAPPLYSWTACYGGFNIGGGAANKSFTDVNGFFIAPGGDLGSHTARGVVGVNLVVAVTDDEWFEMLRQHPNLNEVRISARSSLVKCFCSNCMHRAA